MTWIKLAIQIDESYQEALITELIELDFDGFEQFDDHLEAFIPRTRFNDVSRERIEQLLSLYPGDNYIETEEIQKENWNEEWEQSIQPQTIGRFFVRPTWSVKEPAEGRILLEIDPKMSFGTGYHATTKLMLEELPQLNLPHKKVMDAGTGTGILAIAAAKLGADEVFAFDIDTWSEVNARENVLLNHVGSSVSVALGGIETVPAGRTFDVILANINRNELLKLLPDFALKLKKGGRLVLTGLLESDKSVIREVSSSSDLVLETEKWLEEWILLTFVKKTEGEKS